MIQACWRVHFLETNLENFVHKPTDPRYLAFLAPCIAECDKEHTPEEIAAAEKLLRDPVQVPQFDLILGRSE